MTVHTQSNAASRTTGTRARQQDARSDTATAPQTLWDLPEAHEAPPRDTVGARPEFSEKLRRDLSAHRTAAIQATLVNHPRIALVTLVHRMAETVFGLYGAGDDVVRVTVRMTGDETLAQDASDYAASKAARHLARARVHWEERLPGSPTLLWPWLLTQSESTLLELLAYCTARSVDAVAGRTRSWNQSDALVEALEIDMADWWSPTVNNFFSQVGRSQAIAAVKEACGKDITHATERLKAKTVMSYCAHWLKDVRWLPAPLRRGVSEGPATAATGQGDSTVNG